MSDTIYIKSRSEIEIMRQAGKITAGARSIARQAVAAGVTTKQIDKAVHDFIVKSGAKPTFLNYGGFPGSACVSVNEEVIHGIPGPRVIKPGDIVSLDVTVKVGGYHGDNAVTVVVGEIPPAIQELVDVTKAALEAGIAAAAPGRRLSDVSAAVEKVAREGGCGIVREFVGHGIGRSMHEEPQVPNFGRPGRGPVLQEGMVFCVEPMLTRGSPKVDVLEDKWTVVARDGLPAAHFEHTIAIVPGGAEILTPRDF
jgi:methionyl aminopeptidase